MTMSHVSRRMALTLFASFATVTRSLPGMANPGHPMTVWKDPNCGCCGGWVDHLRRNGFTVSVIESADIDTIKTQRKVPPELASCHTAEIGGFTIEGHVPAAAIVRLIAERPAAFGLAVPGMPIGSPGMEGGTPEAYEVMLFGDSPPASFGRYLGDQPA
jgi:hypothetical protein